MTRDSIVGVSYPKTVEQFEKEGEPLPADLLASPMHWVAAGPLLGL